MATIPNDTVLTLLHEVGVVPLFYHADAGVAQRVLQACYDGGCRIFEFTNRGPEAFETFVSLLDYAHTHLPGMAMGIGTIYDAPTATRFIEAGADFVIAPFLNPAVGQVCVEAGVPWLPGIATLTELYQAEQASAQVVKLFPGEVVGPAFVKASRGPMPHSKIMVTGGVQPTRESFATWFGAGAYCVGMGSHLFPKAILEAEDYGWISTKIAECIGFVKELRG